MLLIPPRCVHHGRGRGATRDFCLVNTLTAHTGFHVEDTVLEFNTKLGNLDSIACCLPGSFLGFCNISVPHSF